jgi:hypothetical protein
MKALEVKKRSYGEDHVIYACTLENLSCVFKLLGEYEEAKKGFLKSLEIYKRCYGEDHV